MDLEAIQHSASAQAREAFRWIRTHWVLTAVLVGVLVLLVVPRLLSAGSAGVVGLRLDDFRSAGQDGEDLVVVVHGMSGAAAMEGVIELVREVYPNAEILVPHFPAGPFSNADPWLLANALELEIHKLDSARKRPYRRIVLVGFSVGALLARKAYVWGHGVAPHVEYGMDLSADRPGGPRPPRSWVERVDRIVLLAGINRGWSTSAKVDEPGCRALSFGPRLLFWTGKKIAQLTGTGELIMAVERGAPFVADLRVQWIRLAQERRLDEPTFGPMNLVAPLAEASESSDASAGRSVAPVVQLLGDIDDVVTQCDDQDLTVSRDFRFVQVRWTGHGDLVELGSRAPEELRREIAIERSSRLREALSWPIGDLDEAYSPDAARAPQRLSRARSNARGSAPQGSKVVFVMHGIRDFGDWTKFVHEKIEEAAQAAKAANDEVEVVRSSYGYFPMGSFLLVSERQKNVRWFMDQYTEVIARDPWAEVSYVGHSNGTYLLASALERYRTLRVENVLFAGSVVRSSYRWRPFLRGPQPRVQRIRNIVASGDWVVGIFPRFYELITELSPISADGFFDLGAAGFRGFGEREVNVESASGGHSAALDAPDEFEAIAKFVVYDDITALKGVFIAKGPMVLADWFSKLCWLIWASLIGVVVFGGRASHRYVGRRFPNLAPYAWIIYAALLLLVLQTV